MDSHEQQSNNVDQGRLAAEAANEIVSKIRAIEASGTTDQQQDQQKTDLAAETVRNYLQSQERLKRLQEAERSGAPSEERQEKIQKEQQNLGLSLIKACALADKNIFVVNNGEAKIILRELNDKDLNLSEAVAIEESLGDYLLVDSGKNIVISKPGEIRSGFLKGIDSLMQRDQEAAGKLIAILIKRANEFRTTLVEIRKNFVQEVPLEAGVGLPNPQDEHMVFSDNPIINAEMFEAGLANDIGYYRSKFTPEQLSLVQTFYSPTAFVEYMEKLGNQASDGTNNPTKVQQEKTEIRKRIKSHYEKNPEALKGRDIRSTVEQDVQRLWDEKVSERIKQEVSGLVNHLFLVLQLKAPNKYYQEILQSADPFFGPAPVLNKIQTAITNLMTKSTQIEREADGTSLLHNKLKRLNFYRHQEQDSYVDERDGKLYPRIKPIPIGRRIPMSKFVESINSMIDTTTQKDEFFLNSRAIYNHPAGKDGFYTQLGEFAESLKGADIDEILMLPDGQYVLEAYQLYEKYLKADFASLDWRHRPDQFQPQLERVNSKLEEEMIKQLILFYPDMTEMRVRSVVNSAIGISRGLTLSEPETSAYADAVDADGQGMVASYSTNDAQSLNVFNSLHNALRWQGEHNWNLMYFMPVEGRHKMWNHEEAKKNMAEYMGSFRAGKGRGVGKDKLPRLFVDILLDINEVGSPQGKRKGWRNDYAFDGHFIYYPEETGKKQNTINPFETFKAMEAIGYEGVSSFIETTKAGKDFLKATKGTEAEEREDFFRYIFKKYICEGDKIENFQESDFDNDFENYMTKLRKAGEERALKYIKGERDEGSEKLREKGIPIINGSWEEQITYATSQIFMESVLTHYTAARMPTIFLKIDRNRFTEDGISSYEKAYRYLRDNDKHPYDEKKEKWSRKDFDEAMKDLGLAEMLLRRQISGRIREEYSINERFGLHQIDKITGLPYRLNKNNIKELLSKNSRGEVGFKDKAKIDRAIKLWEYMNSEFFKSDPNNNNLSYLDRKAFKEIKDYPFTIGLEDTDMSLVAYRGTGPRMVARAIKDTAALDSACTQWLMNMPVIMSEIAVNGKHDFSPLIEFLIKAKKAINDVGGSEPAQEFVYKVSSGIINYFKRDGWAKPLFGLFKFNQINSIAGEYASSSTAVWEWESKEIDQFCIALRSHRLLPGTPYDLNKTEMEEENGIKKAKHIAGKLEEVWWINPITKKPFRTIFKKRHIDFEWNVARLRKDHGADWKAIGWDYISKYLPLFFMILIGKYIKDALEEMMGKKK